ncbi:MAG: DUF1926 domain-containing protein [Nitrospirae bacterium]|nr:DUF1926 domain-containing protein [Nitrospirota bacterium]
MSKLYLILSIHNHQPVGNFDHVLEDAYKKAYLPFLEKLFMHPKLKVVLHYSGNLLLWFEKRRPEAIKMIRELIKSKRVELLSGGFYEPVLSSLPEDDRIMQIEELTSYIRERFNYAPKGMWLAERVWEPHIPKYISKAGIEYVSVDDYHFKLTGLEDRNLLGYHITEEDGYPIKVFPGSEKLRYFIPFKDIDTISSYFREVHMTGGYPLLTLADDGEKFGVWPDTFKHCYEGRWIERFFSMLEENSDWLETTTFDEYRKRFYPVGRVYLPTASYREMGEWTLPPESALDYEHALTEMQKLFGDRAKGFLRGGIWRSFFTKYSESNHIHKRMLMISKKVHKAIGKLKVRSSKLKTKKQTIHNSRFTIHDLLHELWRGQCNDAYWHGIFGGLYLPHLRSSLYRHLLNAESMAEDILSNGKRVRGSKDQGARTFIEEGDLDCDGFKDICISKKDISAFFTEESGSLIELSIKNRQINVLDILTRRPEAYHSRISESTSGVPDSGETKTIHDRLLVKEAGLLDYLVYDNYRRASLLDHFFDHDIKLDDLIRSEYEERGDFIGSPYSLEAISRKGSAGVRFSRRGLVSGCDFKIEKSVLLKGSKIMADYLLDGDYKGIFAIEFNLSFLGSPYASVHVSPVRNSSVTCPAAVQQSIISNGENNNSFFIKDKGMHNDIAEFYIKDEFLNLKLSFFFDEDIDMWHYPVETISLSDLGVEKLYQGTAFLFMKKIDHCNNKKLGFTIELGRNK